MPVTGLEFRGLPRCLHCSLFQEGAGLARSGGGVGDAHAGSFQGKASAMRGTALGECSHLATGRLPPAQLLRSHFRSTGPGQSPGESLADSFPRLLRSGAEKEAKACRKYVHVHVCEHSVSLGVEGPKGRRGWSHSSAQKQGCTPESRQVNLQRADEQMRKYRKWKIGDGQANSEGGRGQRESGPWTGARSPHLPGTVLRQRAQSPSSCSHPLLSACFLIYLQHVDAMHLPRAPCPKTPHP